MLQHTYNQHLESLREPRNLVDIALVFLLVYALLRLIRGTRAVPMAAGIGGLALLYWTAARYDLATLEFLLRPAPVYIGVAIIVLFQNEIRQALISFGNRVRMPFLIRHRGQFGEGVYDEIVLAATTLASTKTGALIVVERGVNLRIVSEETGLISFVQGGQIRRGLDGTRLRAAILDALEPGARAAAEEEEKQAESETSKTEVRGQMLEVSEKTSSNL